MKFTQNTLSYNLSFDEALSRLAASKTVDGIALFGSRAASAKDTISDYDVLLLVTHLPVRIFQMLTHIQGRMADVVFVETGMADRWLTTPQAVPANSFEGMFLLKMHTANILYDASGRLQRVQQRVKPDQSSIDWLLPSPYPDRYAAWFWQNHGLYHLKRMVQSSDPVYQTAVDLMMRVSDVCRAYYCVRNLPWQGEKAAIRYFQHHDPEYLILLRNCLAAVDRKHKVELYEQLMTKAIAPAGPVWTPGITAVYLADPTQHATHTETALAFWESLFTEESSDSLLQASA
jgi:hypothetical protein